MLAVKRKYITDKRRRRTTVVLRINDFEKMEEVIENYALFQLMKEAAMKNH